MQQTFQDLSKDCSVKWKDFRSYAVIVTILKHNKRKMPQFRFYADQKCTVWDRLKFVIEADSEEAAIAEVKQRFEEDGLDSFEGEWDKIEDTMENIRVEDNDGWATEEVYFDDRPHDVVIANGKH